MTIEVNPSYLPQPTAQPEPAAKRFFTMDEMPCGEPSYTFVARDLEHAKQMLRDSHCEFGDPSMPYDAAEAAGMFDWKEIEPTRAAKINVDYCGDKGRGMTPLAECDLGDWFCSEY